MKTSQDTTAISIRALLLLVTANIDRSQFYSDNTNQKSNDLASRGFSNW